MSPLILILVASSTTATWLDRVVAGDECLPALSAVQTAAVEAMNVPPGDAVLDWSRRARLRGFVPRLNAVVGTDSDLDVRDSLSTSRSRITTEGRAFGFELAARWELGELVFSDWELRAHREALARSAAVRLVRDRVTRLYFQRVEVLMRQRRRNLAEDSFEAARLEGLLNALTGGRWTALRGLAK